MDSDAQLLERYVRAGSEPAFTGLVTRHINGVYRAALRQLDGNAALAEEVTQTVFTQFAAKAGGLSADVVIAGWLYNTTHYTVANVRRAEFRRLRREQEAYRMHCDDNGDDPKLDWQRLRPVLDEVLWSLKQADREAVLLRFFDDRSYKEIAAALRLSEDAARRRVDRALEQLRDLLARREISSTTTAIATLMAQQTSVAAPAGLAALVAQHAVHAGAEAVPAGVMTLMASSKTMMIVAGACAVLLVSSGVREAVALRAASTEHASLVTEVAALRAEVAAEETRTLATEQAAAAVQSGRPNPGRGATASEPAQGGAYADAATSDPEAAGEAFLKRHPEVKRALTDYALGGIRTDYGELYRKLQLTPDQIARFEAVLLHNQGFGREVATGTLQFRVASDISFEERTVQLKDILGEAKYEVYLKHAYAEEARRMAANVASLALAIDSPMTSEQATTLARTFTANTKSSTYDWDGILEQARGFLRPEQVELLERTRAHAEAWQKVTDATR